MSDPTDPFAEPEFSRQVHEARYFHLARREGADPGLVVICGGRETCAPDYLIDRPTFPCYGIEWVERGRGWVGLGAERSEIQAASVFCYGPGVAYRMRTDPDRVMTKCFIDFAGPEAPGLLAAAAIVPGRPLQVSSALELSEVFEGLYREGMRPGPGSGEIGAAYLRLLLLKVRALLVPSRSGGSPRLGAFLRARQFLLDESARFSTAEEVARELKLSPSSLCRLFREHGEVSPYQLLTRARMNHALDRLILGGGCVKRACYESGYTDPDHFSRLFKKVHGLPPSELAAQILRDRSAARTPPGPVG